MNRETLPDGVRLYDAKCSAIIRRPRDYVEYIVAKGVAPASAADFILDQRDKIVRECGRIALFDDLEELTGYESELRIRLTEWSRKNRSKVVGFHIFTRSRLVAMGVTVANLALGGTIRAHLRRETFEAALREAVNAR
jgi:hypothetical protein